MKALYKWLLLLLLWPLAGTAQDSGLNPEAIIFNTTPVNPMVRAVYGLQGIDQQYFYDFSRLTTDTFSLGDDLKWWILDRDRLSLNTALMVPLQSTSLDLSRLRFSSRYSGFFDTWEVGKTLLTPNPPTSRFSIVHTLGEEMGAVIYYEAFSIVSDKVGIGTTSPTQNLDVNGNARFRDVPVGTGNYYLRLTSDGSLSKVSIASDRRLKENIETLEDALGKVLAMRGVSYTLKSHPEAGIQHGLIAQELSEVVPELVEFDGEYYSIRYDQFPALLIEAIKEQQAIIARQQSEIEALKQVYGRIVKLEKMLGVANVY